MSDGNREVGAGRLAALKRHAAAVFRERYGRAPQGFGVAPARVELLGNHTDYNGGLVMSAALDRHTVVAGAPAAGGRIAVFSTYFNEEWQCHGARGQAADGWKRYVQGVVAGCGHAVGARGFDAVIAGSIPLGTGLSSSASLEAALAVFLQGLGDRGGAADDATRFHLARELQRVENEDVGVACGLLDQYSVLFGRAGHALWMDCASQEHGRVSLGVDAPAIVVCDTKTSRRLADGKYNERRGECEQVVAFFQALGDFKPVRTLRDVSPGDLEEHWTNLDEPARCRARHVITENERVTNGIEALRRGDAVALGRLMSASHLSSRDDFENSSPALDAMIDAAQGAPGFLGGKLSGAGWAGCTVNLVTPELAEAFQEAVSVAYARRTGITPEIHICQAADGAFFFDAAEPNDGPQPEGQR